MLVGKTDATDAEIDDGDRRRSASRDRFDAFPEGLDTEVRERGSRLSAGERQLVSLVRAALADPTLLVLDEATSNLDPGTERAVERALERLTEGRTVVVVAHRLSTAARADRIAVVDDGRVEELGTHDELIAREGRYASLYAALGLTRRHGPRLLKPFLSSVLASLLRHMGGTATPKSPGLGIAVDRAEQLVPDQGAEGANEPPVERELAE